MNESISTEVVTPTLLDLPVGDVLVAQPEVVAVQDETHVGQEIIAQEASADQQ